MITHTYSLDDDNDDGDGEERRRNSRALWNVKRKLTIFENLITTRVELFSVHFSRSLQAGETINNKTKKFFPPLSLSLSLFLLLLRFFHNEYSFT